VLVPSMSKLRGCSAGAPFCSRTGLWPPDCRGLSGAEIPDGKIPHGLIPSADIPNEGIPSARDFTSAPPSLPPLEAPKLLDRLSNGLAARRLRLMDCLGLRVQDVNVGCMEITLRDGKEGKAQTTLIPKSLSGQLEDREGVKATPHETVRRGGGESPCPMPCIGSTRMRRGSGVGGTPRPANRLARRTSPHALATHLCPASCDTWTIQEVPRQEAVSTARISPTSRTREAWAREAPSTDSHPSRTDEPTYADWIYPGEKGGTRAA
jgi:integrase